MKSDVIFYGGIKWRRYPESSRRNDRLYYKPASHYFEGGWEQYLHRQVWRDANGPIPSGCHIHHVDGDTLNNDLANLQCMTSKQHSKHHADTATEDQREASRRLMDKLRPLASAWHRSDEGRKWHSAIGAASWVGRKPTAHVCEQCGNPYQTISSHGNSRFCSNACKSEFRRRSGLDNIVRACEKCGQMFTANKYLRQRFCSKSCTPGRPKKQ